MHIESVVLKPCARALRFGAQIIRNKASIARGTLGSTIARGTLGMRAYERNCEKLLHFLCNCIFLVNVVTLSRVLSRLVAMW